MEKQAVTNETKWKEHLIKNLELDSLATDTIPSGSYRAIVGFVIDKNGTIGEVRILKDPGYGLGQRLKEVILCYPGKWKPAEHNGRIVKDYRSQSAEFVIEGEEIHPCPGTVPEINIQAVINP